MGYVIGVIIWGLVWGFATNAVIHNKGYEENWFWWGFFFGFFALIVALTKPENRSYTSYTSYSGDSTSRFDRDPYDYGNKTSNGSSSLFGDKSQEMLRQGGWKCDCGRVNYAYIGTCACGRTRAEVEEKKRKAEESKQEYYQQDKTDELANLSAIKELKGLLDEGIISQEEFDVKKKQLLGL